MIRKINSKDKSEFLSMCKAFYSTEGVLHTIPEKYMENTFAEAAKETSPYCHCYIIEENEKTAGYILLALTFSNEVGGLAVWLDELYIKPEFQNKGLGKKSLSFIKEEYSHAKRIRLEITESNKIAENLYKKENFKPLSYLQMIFDKD